MSSLSGLRNHFNLKMTWVILGDTVLKPPISLAIKDVCFIKSDIEELLYYFKQIEDENIDFLVIAFDKCTYIEAEYLCKQLAIIQNHISYPLFLWMPLPPTKQCFHPHKIQEQVNNYIKIREIFNTYIQSLDTNTIQIIDIGASISFSNHVSLLAVQDPEILTCLFECELVKKLSYEEQWYSNAVNFIWKGKLLL